MYAGPERKASLGNFLCHLCERAGILLILEEWDILRNAEHDLSDEAVRQALLKRIESGEFDYIFMSPPCNTWSRAVHSNMWGPRPLRNRAWPRGFPWLEGKFQELARLGNVLVDFCFTICHLISTSQFPFRVKIICEHPEDLGSSHDLMGRPVFPASIWQLPECQSLFTLSGWLTIALFQCRYGVDRLKPTRLLGNIQGLQHMGSVGPPTFHPDGSYAGPLPRTCTHGGHPPLIKQSASDDFATTGTGVYPPAMDAALATLIFEDFQQIPSCGGADEASGGSGVGDLYSADQSFVTKAQGDPVTGVEVDPVTREPTSLLTEASDGPVTGAAVGQEGPVTGAQAGFSVTGDLPMELDDAEPDPSSSSSKVGGQPVLKAHYKGKSRPFHDGLGLCSLGRLKTCNRRRKKGKLMEDLREVFWRRLDSWLLAKGKQEELKLLASMLCGRQAAHPFESLVSAIHEDWCKLLEEEGYTPQKKSGDRESQIDFRLLQAMAEAAGDADWAYLEEMASTGVKLGTEGEIPRVPEVYEEKTRWNLSDPTPGVWHGEAVRENYLSAKGHLEKVREQVDKDLAKGDIIAMDLQEARKRYGSTLKVASLAAVPKDPEWEQVRVVHDATHGVEVNHHIKICNQMRFPLFDDLEAAMAQFLSEADSRRLCMAFDYKGAHRLIPIHESEWGKQAFRLDEQGPVYLNRVGTFGVASAAFWWGRVAGTLQRVLWQFFSPGSPIYSLLYADDGLMLASGPDYRKNLIAALLYLTVLGAPLSWGKTRGGQNVEWLGYQVDVQKGKVGISARKVEWLVSWVQNVLRNEGVLGRDIKAALGRMGFLAGPLKQARPFLALIYRWAAKVNPSTYTSIPLAVRLTLQFFVSAVQSLPMRIPRGVPRPGGEVFRVDAKADGGTVSIGGWETYGGVNPKNARWFAIQLDRKNAPWIYVKGEPFKVISTLELLAITASLMIFGPDSKWKSLSGRLSLTAFTDNQTNSFILDKYMTTAFPASAVLMELAMQLQEYDLTLDLQWIPREQNVEADDLTNGRFDSFSAENEIKVEMQDLNFKVLHQLMSLAESIDHEIVQKRTSKPTAAYVDPSKKMRITQPW